MSTRMILLAFAGVGAAIGTLTVGAVRFALKFPRGDDLAVFVSRSCPHSNDLEEQLLRRPELLDRVVVLPTSVEHA